MSRTRRSDYPRTGKEIGRGECPEDFRIRQRRGLVKNAIFDQETREEIWGPKSKKSFKRNHAKKERRIVKNKLKSFKKGI